jgi:hypothetical protein
MTRTAVYGPVRTVVWQGSAGNRRPYADLTGKSEVIHMTKNALPVDVASGGCPEVRFLEVSHGQIMELMKSEDRPLVSWTKFLVKWSGSVSDSRLSSCDISSDHIQVVAGRFERLLGVMVRHEPGVIVKGHIAFPAQAVRGTISRPACFLSTRDRNNR